MESLAPGFSLAQIWLLQPQQYWVSAVAGVGGSAHTNGEEVSREKRK